MKKLVMLSISAFLLTSCVATHIGTISTSSIGKPMVYEDIAYGVAQTNRYFGIGGLSQDALVLEAKRELIKGRLLKPNEEYLNFTVDYKNSYWPFYIQTKVTLSADVVRYTSETISDPYSENYKNKLLGKSTINGFFTLGDSIVDKKLKKGTIISFEGSDKVRIVYKNNTNKIQTKKMAIDAIYSTTKTQNGLKTGSMYESNGNNGVSVAEVIAVGQNSLLIKGNSNKAKVVKYK